jgi:hypothetical protein
MYYVVKIAPLALLQSLITILTESENTIKAINYNDLYKVNGYRSRDIEVLQSQDSNRVSASELCNKGGMELFLVRPEFDMRAIFAKFGVERVWVDLYYSKTYSLLLDMKNNYPTVLAKNSLRIDSDITIGPTLAADKDIALQLKDGEFKYVPVSKTETISVLCMKHLSFPYRESDIYDLTQLRDDLVKALYNKRLEVSAKIERMNSLDAFIPKLPSGTVLSYDNYMDKNTKLEERINNVKEELKKIEKALQKMEETQSYFRITLPYQTQVEKINDLLIEMLNLFDSPKSVFEYIYHSELPAFNKQGEIPLQIYAHTENRYVIKLGIADITSKDYIVNDLYDFIQFSEKNRVQLIDLILFVISSVGVLVAGLSGMCQMAEGVCKNREKKEAVTELMQKRRDRAAKTRKRLVHSIRSTKLPAKNVPIARTTPRVVPRIHAIQAEIHAPPVIETSFSQIRPTVTQKQVSTIQDVKEILQILHDTPPKREERTLPIYSPVKETAKSTKSKKPATTSKGKIPLWLEPSSESE